VNPVYKYVLTNSYHITQYKATKADILINRANNTTRHNQKPILLFLLTTVLVTDIFTTNEPTAVFAQSTNLKQDINQGARCDTVGSDSSVSNSRNQQPANNVNNSVPTSGRLGAKGTLLINEVCDISGIIDCSIAIFSTTVIGNNPQPSSFSFTVRLATS